MDAAQASASDSRGQKRRRNDDGGQAGKRGRGRGGGRGRGRGRGGHRGGFSSGSPSTSNDVGTEVSTRKKHYHPRPSSAESGSGVISINPIKSSLRQTRRLLSKPNLTEDVRLEAERRLKALEAELVKAEAQQKQRKLMGRYHKVKFFERRKLERRIGKWKRLIKDEATGAKEKKQAEKEIWKDRVLLNYVLHFPASEKYVSLLLSSAEADAIEKETSEPMTEKESKKALQAALQIKAQIEERMRNGELSHEPEVLLKEGYKEKRRAANEGEERNGEEAEEDEEADEQDDEEDRDEDNESSPSNEESSSESSSDENSSEEEEAPDPVVAVARRKTKAKASAAVAQDDFFDV